MGCVCVNHHIDGWLSDLSRVWVQGVFACRQLLFRIRFFFTICAVFLIGFFGFAWPWKLTLRQRLVVPRCLLLKIVSSCQRQLQQQPHRCCQCASVGGRWPTKSRNTNTSNKKKKKNKPDHTACKWS